MKALVVEDSRTTRAWLVRLLKADGIDVVEAGDGLAAIRLAAAERPDVVLMDLQLPGCSGLEAIEAIMASAPRPIVVLSGQLRKADVDLAFEALQLGALDVLAKPGRASASEQADHGARLLRVLRLMARVKVVRRRHQGLARARTPVTVPTVQDLRGVQLLAMGGSTGAPPIVHGLLERLPVPLRVPVVVIQHIGVGFEDGYARYLDGAGHPAHVVRGEEALEPGCVYVAPADASIVLLSPDRLTLDRRPPPASSGMLPSVDRTFESLAEQLGGRCAAVLLSGMGRDGARGLAALRDRGAATFAQDEASSAVFGMPRAAMELGAVDVLSVPEQLGATLAEGLG